MGVCRAAFIIVLTPTLLCFGGGLLIAVTHLLGGVASIGEGGEAVTNEWFRRGVWLSVDMLMCLVPTTLFGVVLAVAAEALDSHGM